MTGDPDAKVFPWDYTEIWYATSKDGYEWKEQGLAVGVITSYSIHYTKLYDAQTATRIEGDILTSQIPDEQIWIQRVPYGVVSGLCAWNFPLALACRKIAGALVCGNTIVIKPPSETPLAVMKLGELCDEIGLPAGVLNLISGNATDVGNELVSNPITQLVTLTGSTRAGP